MIFVNDTEELIIINRSTAEYHLLKDKGLGRKYDCLRRISERKVAITRQEENRYIVHQFEID